MPIELRRYEIPPVLASALGVRDVSRRLLEVRHQPAALEHLGEDVGRVLHSDVHATQLRDRVVAVLVEDLLEQSLGARGADVTPRVARCRGRCDRRSELVEKQTPQRFRRTGIACEERALDGFRQIDEREHGLVHVREVRGQRRRFHVGERHSSSSSVQKRRYSSMKVSDSNVGMRSKKSTPSRWSVSC